MIDKVVNKRQVVKLSAININGQKKKYLSMEYCNMSDIRKGDIFFMLDNMALVLGKNEAFLYKAKTNGIPHLDTYLVQCDEL